MKGIVFTELIEMVENDLGVEIADRMIVGANLENDGAYTAVGTYDHGQLIQLVLSLSAETKVPVPDLVRSFGVHLLGRFHALYPQFFAASKSTFDFLPLVESYIHVEVRKLYPDAELPSFDCLMDGQTLVMTYRSKRPFADLAEGLIQATAEHYGDEVEIARENLGAKDGTEAEFRITPIAC